MGDFSELEGGGINEDETVITTSTDGLFYALVYAPSHRAKDPSHRKPLSWEQAQAVFAAVNAKAGLTGDQRWVAPEPQSVAAIEALRPTNQPGGYALPAAVNPDAANVPNPAHKVAAQYERVLAYQIHQGGGQFAAGQIVVWWGDTIGSNGSGDVISVDATTGQVTLWDSKAYASGNEAIESDTFKVDGRRRRWHMQFGWLNNLRGRTRTNAPEGFGIKLSRRSEPRQETTG